MDRSVLRPLNTEVQKAVSRDQTSCGTCAKFQLHTPSNTPSASYTQHNVTPLSSFFCFYALVHAHRSSWKSWIQPKMMPLWQKRAAGLFCCSTPRSTPCPSRLCHRDELQNFFCCSIVCPDCGRGTSCGTFLFNPPFHPVPSTSV